MTLARFKQKIQKEQFYYLILLFILLLFVFTFCFFFVRNQNQANTHTHFGSGLIVGICFGLIITIMHYYRKNKVALTSELSLKNHYIHVMDERDKTIKHKAVTLSTRILMIILMLAAAYFAFSNITISYVILTIIYITFIIYQLCIFYLRRQF